MKLGLHLNSFNWEGGPARFAERLGDIGAAAEAAGFDLIAVADHVWLSPWMGGPEGPHPEAYTTLAFLAAKTSRVKLMTLVTAASYRHPGMLAKTVTTLDVLSGGRTWLGIGAGDDEPEARGLGLPFPPLGDRHGRGHVHNIARIGHDCKASWQDSAPVRVAHVARGPALGSAGTLTAFSS
jgi:alkanesulfonate monooxygenase SsuD/methylene tetrahydromethanopterin reductase-like flavin-dependent oxidoreductase (luciferase family)